MMVPDKLDAGTEMIEKRMPFSTKKKRPKFLQRYPLQNMLLRCSTVRLPRSKSCYEAATPKVFQNLMWRRRGDVTSQAVKQEVDVKAVMLRKLFKFHTMKKYLWMLRDQNSVDRMTEIQPVWLVLSRSNWLFKEIRRNWFSWSVKRCILCQACTLISFQWTFSYLGMSIWNIYYRRIR